MSENLLLKVDHIDKRFPGVYALRDMHFEVYSGEVHALVGENGAGKSTLIKCIAGIYNVDEGEIWFDGKKCNFARPIDAIKAGISVIYQELNLIPDMSIQENIYFANLPKGPIGKINWKELETKTQALLDYIGLDEKPSMKVGYLPVAKQQLVEISKAIATNAKVIIMDEPTSALSPTEIKNLYRIINDLRDKGVGIIYISHKMDEIFTLSNRITVLRDGTYVDTVNVGDVTQDQLISLMVGRELKSMYPRTEMIPGEIVLDVKNLTTNRVKDASFDVKAGEIVGFSGLMGAGRSELALGIIGADKRIAGTVSVSGKKVAPNSTDQAQRCGIGFLPEDRKRHGIFANLNIIRNMTVSSVSQFCRLNIINRAQEIEVVNDMSEKLSIKTPSIYQIITKLSGGNQQKVLLARFLSKKGLKVLIIDEPTRGIDVGAKAEIYQILDELSHQGLAIVIMSSEMPEILSMCDRVYVMKKGRITAEFNKSDASQEALLEKAI